MNIKRSQSEKGFTLIYILVVIAIIAIIAAIVIVAINPAKRFQDARNSQRHANVEAILGAMQQQMIDKKGIFTCEGVILPDTVATAAEISNTGIDIAPCLSDYLAIFPVDPGSATVAAGTWTNVDTYNTKYTIWQATSTKQITITAPTAS